MGPPSFGRLFDSSTRRQPPFFTGAGLGGASFVAVEVGGAAVSPPCFSGLRSVAVTTGRRRSLTATLRLDGLCPAASPTSADGPPPARVGRLERFPSPSVG